MAQSNSPQSEVDDVFFAEMLSTISMTVVATWTVSTGAYRALTTRALLRETGDIQPVIDMRSAMMIPVISSATLLLLFFLFKYIQSFLVLYMVVASFGAVSMCLLEPLSIHWPRFVAARSLPSCLACGWIEPTKLASFGAILVVTMWLITGHWLALDILGVCITISVISLIRLPSLKVASIVLLSLFIYDIFWVFFSSRFFGQNVMVEVATKKADNPLQALGENLEIPMMRDATQTLQLPIKLMFPAGIRNGFLTFHMLGLGDMAIPGIFLAFALSFDSYLENERDRKDGGTDVEVGLNVDKSSKLSEASSLPVSTTSSSSASSSSASTTTLPSLPPFPKNCSYFRHAQIGYVSGIILSISASMIFGAAQPALLYLVPCVLIPIISRAYCRNHLNLLWIGFSFDDENCDDDEEAVTNLHSDTNDGGSSDGVVVGDNEDAKDKQDSR